MMRVVRQRNFALLWMAGLVSLLGDWAFYIVMPVFVLHETGSVFLAGIVWAVIALPSVVLGPVAGVYVDRWDRRQIMLWGNVAQAIAAVVLVIGWCGSRHLGRDGRAAGQCQSGLGHPARRECPPADPGAGRRSGAGQRPQRDERQPGPHRRADRGRSGVRPIRDPRRRDHQRGVVSGRGVAGARGGRRTVRRRTGAPGGRRAGEPFLRSLRTGVTSSGSTGCSARSF